MSPERNKLAATSEHRHTHIYTHTLGLRLSVYQYTARVRKLLSFFTLSRSWWKTIDLNQVQALTFSCFHLQNYETAYFRQPKPIGQFKCAKLCCCRASPLIKNDISRLMSVIGNWKNNVETKTEREGLDTARQDWGFRIIVKEESQTNAQDNQKDRLLPKANKVQYIFWLWQ